MAKCPHGYLSFWSCEQCIYGDEPPPPPPKSERPTVLVRFAARYDGQCNGCNLPIHVGQPIVRMSDDRYLHAGCES